MSQLKSGQYWLGKLESALVPVATYMATSRYGNVPDVDLPGGAALDHRAGW